MMRLRVEGGMCNRLQAILSYRALHRELAVIWELSGTVHGSHFLDVFEPLPGVTFLRSDKPHDVSDWAVAKGAPEGWEQGYRDLNPVETIRARGGHPNWRMALHYLAIHVRRTDHVPNAESQGLVTETRGEFDSWAQQWPDLKVYVATDNRDTQDSIQALGSRYVVGYLLPPSQATQANGDQTRHGTLADAVLDLFTCAGADHFKGSRGSSFTATIERLRALR